MSGHQKKRQIKGAGKPEYKGEHVPSGEEVRAELCKSKWGSTFLTQYLSDAEKNVQITYVQKRGYFEMLDDLGELLQKANTHLKISTSDVSNGVVVLLFGRATGTFLAAVRLAASGQITESYAQSRACIENGLYAFYIHNDPSLAEIWLNRHESSEARKACKGSFKMGKIWESLKLKDTGLEGRVHDAYDTCIDLGAHPNERSVTMNVEAGAEGGVTLQLFNTREIDLDFSLLGVVHMVLCVVEIFERVFPEQFKAINSTERRRNIQEQHDRIAPGVIARVRAPEEERRKRDKT